MIDTTKLPDFLTTEWAKRIVARQEQEVQA